MRLTFQGVGEIDAGTLQQQTLFQAAFDAITFPTTRLNLDVVVGFGPDPCPDMDHELACTFVTFEGEGLNNCGRPTSASIVMLDGLEEETGNAFRGIRMFYDVVAHEIGHVASAWLTDVQRGELCVLFGGQPSNWRPENAPWPDLIQEAQAEFFKDVFMPKELRRYDNRTNWKLPRANFPAWLEIMSTLCTCPGAAS